MVRGINQNMITSVEGGQDLTRTHGWVKSLDIVCKSDDILVIHDNHLFENFWILHCYFK